MRNLIVLFLLPLTASAGDFKEEKEKCLRNIDNTKLVQITEQLELWTMRKANQEIILSMIISDLTLECIEKSLTNK